MTLKVGMQHWLLKFYQVYSNDDPGMALTILCQGQIWPLMLLYGKKVKNGFFSETIVVFISKLVDVVT